MRNRDMIGFGIRLTPKEKRRLDRLAERCARKPAGVVRRLVQLTDPENEEDVRRLKGLFCIDEKELYHAKR